MPIEEAQRIHQDRVSQLKATLATLPLVRPALTLEIGCGHGHFLTAYAAKNPSEHCVAVDIILERLEKARRKTDAAGLTNVSWIRATAEDFFEALPPKVIFDRQVFILFPDPWPKRKHWKNRLIQPAFLDRLAELTAPDTQLCFRTDHDPYFAAATKVIRAHPRWEVDATPAWPFEHRTVFEARAERFQSLTARRTSG
jgi:tRNA (guanine-N7-)-methyltransferase